MVCATNIVMSYHLQVGVRINWCAERIAKINLPDVQAESQATSAEVVLTWILSLTVLQEQLLFMLEVTANL